MSNFNLRTILNTTTRMVVGFHPDADGISSMAMIVKSCEGKDFLLLAVDSQLRDFSKGQLQRISKFDPELIINLDYYPNNKNQFDELAAKYHFLTIDHHLMIKDRVSWQGEVLINPEILGRDSEKFSCSKIVFDLLEFSELKWLALIGVLGDNVGKYWPKWTKDFSGDEIKNANILSDIISYIALADKNEAFINELVLAAIKSKSLSTLHANIVENKKLSAAFKVIELEISYNFDKMMQSLGGSNMAIVEIKSKKKFAIIELLAKTVENVLVGGKTLICYQYIKDLAEIRVMTEDTKLNCAVLFNGFGGGHQKRAGGSVKKAQLKEALILINKRIKEQEVAVG